MPRGRAVEPRRANGGREAPKTRRKRREAKTKGKGESAKKKKGGSFCHFRGRAPSLPPITLWPYLIHRLPRLPERVYISAVSLVTTTQMGIFSRDMTCRCGIPPASKQESIYRQRRRRGGKGKACGEASEEPKGAFF